METLVNASPATVSRAGIIFVSDTDLDWSPVVEGWILKRPAAEQPVFKELFSRSVLSRLVAKACRSRYAPQTCSLLLSALVGFLKLVYHIPDSVCHVLHIVLWPIVQTEGTNAYDCDAYSLRYFSSRWMGESEPTNPGHCIDFLNRNTSQVRPEEFHDDIFRVSGGYGIQTVFSHDG